MDREIIMRLHAVLLALLLTLLAGCGGGYVAVGIGSGFDDVSFITWSGSANSDRVVDVNNHPFAFYSDNGCLYNFQTGRENRAFCLVPGSTTVFFAGLRLRVVNIQSVSGVCIAALLEERTGNFVDVELDPYGRELVAVTQLRPLVCPA
jgi:hypothetical protein